jgi:hypothetical protein
MSRINGEKSRAATAIRRRNEQRLRMRELRRRFLASRPAVPSPAPPAPAKPEPRPAPQPQAAQPPEKGSGKAATPAKAPRTRKKSAS